MDAPSKPHRRKVVAIRAAFLRGLLTDQAHAYGVVKDALPADIVIVDARMSPDGQSLLLFVESKSFPETPEGQPYPVIQPEIRAD